MNAPREVELDTRGSLCPQPIIDLAEEVERLPVGAVVRILSDDAAIVYDLPAWCQATGHELVSLEPQGREHIGRVRKKHDPS